MRFWCYSKLTFHDHPFRCYSRSTPEEDAVQVRPYASMLGTDALRLIADAYLASRWGEPHHSSRTERKTKYVAIELLIVPNDDYYRRTSPRNADYSPIRTILMRFVLECGVFNTTSDEYNKRQLEKNIVAFDNTITMSRPTWFIDNVLIGSSSFTVTFTRYSPCIVPVNLHICDCVIIWCSESIVVHVNLYYHW